MLRTSSPAKKSLRLECGCIDTQALGANLEVSTNTTTIRSEHLDANSPTFPSQALLHRTAILLVVTSALLFTSPAQAFIRGDANDDGTLNISDAVNILTSLFTPGAPPIECHDAVDVNDDGSVNIGDPVYLLAWLFTMGSPPPPEPYPCDGTDPTPDMLPPGSCGAPPVVMPGGYTTVGSGTSSGLADGDYIARNPNAWANLWSMHMPGSPPPQINFQNDMIIGVVRHFVNGTHCAEILNLTDAMTDVIVDARVQSWQLPCAPSIIPSQVWHFVVWQDANAAMVSSSLIVNNTTINTCPLTCP